MSRVHMVDFRESEPPAGPADWVVMGSFACGCIWATCIHILVACW